MFFALNRSNWLILTTTTTTTTCTWLFHFFFIIFTNHTPFEMCQWQILSSSKFSRFQVYFLFFQTKIKSDYFDYWIRQWKKKSNYPNGSTTITTTSDHTKCRNRFECLFRMFEFFHTFFSPQCMFVLWPKETTKKR